MTYSIENGNVYRIEKISSAEITSCFGPEKQLALISESNTEKVFAWQKFDTEKGEYIPDTENTEPTNIEGKEYKPAEGKIIVKKASAEASAEMKIKQLTEELEKKDLENKRALAEIFEMIEEKGGEA